MTDKEKASEVLRYMEEDLDSKTVINLINYLLKDEDLATIYDGLVNDGIFEADEPEVGSIEAAVKYIRENMSEVELAIISSEVDKCYEMHLVPNDSVIDCGKVIDLLEEYGEEHDLGSDWYLSELEIDDIMCRL